MSRRIDNAGIEMAPYKVTLAYDGTHYFGMQKQASEQTIQSEFESALKKLGWQEKSITFAGRTDRGVHASGQVVAFTLDWAHAREKLRDALNAYLANEIAVQQVEKVGKKFHPRFDARRRNYRYRIISKAGRDPLRSRFAWQLWPVNEIEQLNKVSDGLIGRKDFSAFGTPPKKGGSTIREIYQAQWARDNEDEIIFDVSANGFLYHMVRRIVAYLVNTSKKSEDADDLHQILAQGKLIQELAPARGLNLMSVEY